MVTTLSEIIRFNWASHVMKTLYLIALITLPLTVIGQQITASNEPLVLFQDASHSLDLDDTRQAIRSFEKAVDWYVDHNLEKDLPESYFAMALMLALNGDYRHSVRYHRKAIRAHKKLKGGEPIEMIINLGLTYELAGNKRKAKRILGSNYLTS